MAQSSLKGEAVWFLSTKKENQCYEGTSKRHICSNLRYKSILKHIIVQHILLVFLCGIKCSVLPAFLNFGPPQTTLFSSSF